MDVFRQLFGNGPVETGLSAGTEKYVQAESGAIKGRDIKCTYKFTLESIVPIGTNPTRFHKAIAGAAALAHTGGFGAVDNWSTGAGPRAGNTDDIADEELKQAFEDAVSVIVATKVNWFKGNHHTGGKIATGFVARAYSIITGGTVPIDEANTSLAWRAGHWFDTRAWLASLGVPGIRATQGTVFPIAVDDAVRKRISSAPAGSASFEAIYSGILYISSHPVLCAANAPALLEWNAWVACHAAIERNPARFHIGSTYLTGKDQIKVPAVPDPIVGFVATCIRYANRDATLLKAAIFKNVADDAATLSAIRSASEFAKVDRRAVGVAQWINASVASKGPKRGAGGDDDADDGAGPEPNAIAGAPEPDPEDPDGDGSDDERDEAQA